ncbi:MULTISPECIES: TRASH domain-containing protein [Thermococcus]|uniref:Transcriptional regulatory protein, asnC family n=1 Tax=Thermococcus sibiricus (strain DSM 12597 / MM 739) TaxID=604354 RepID=C6A561_THESM|nr:MULTISPECIES: TRASH domain-containing protein [Thermococcus]ACS90756.1 Transcriptional regulatory protein, asnC family [Thermococcus sibiricus MM 739]MBC7094221.1 TRASH domain-containing protein [Thermococcus sp.]
MTKLDDLDLKLIYLLLDNARLSISELAERLGISRPTVKSRLEKLEKEGVIRGYTIKLNPELLRAHNVVALIVKTEKPEKMDELEEIIEINRFTSTKYLIKVAVNSMEDLKRVIEETSVEVIEVMPILEGREKRLKPKIKVPFKCDYCGKEIIGEPIVHKYHNKVYFFCCPTCLREFKRTRENIEKFKLKEEDKVEHAHEH